MPYIQDVSSSLFTSAAGEHVSATVICADISGEIAIWTGLSRSLDADGEAAIRKTSPFWKNLDQGAATVLVAALDPALNGESQFTLFVKYALVIILLILLLCIEPNDILLHDCQIFEAAPHATDPKIAQRLWELSEELVKQEFKL